jgi:beta-glucosidase
VELKYLDTDGNVQYKTIRATTGIMSSFNRIGSVWTGACKELVTNVLRNEWGFIGTVITDYNDEPQMDVEAGVVAGNDLMLANASTLASSFRDTTKASTVKAMRQAVKNIVYTQVNSNTVNGTSDSTTVTYGMAPWRMALYAVDAVLVVLAAVLIFLGIKQSRKTVVKVDAANN